MKNFTYLGIAAALAASCLSLGVTAAAANGGQLIKGASFSSVYYLAGDGKRYVFPNDKTFRTWYPDFSGVTTVSDQVLASYAIGGNVTYRPGRKLVKIQTDPKVYAVDKGGLLRWVTTESLAAQLYGAAWSQQVDDVPDIFFINYNLGAPIASAGDYAASTVMAAVPTIDDDFIVQLPTTPVSTDTTPATDGQASAAPYDGTSEPSLVAGSGLGTVLAKYKFTANYEELKLTKIRLQTADATGVARLSLYDGATLVGGPVAVDGAGNADFSGVNFIIPKDGSKDLIVRADLNQVGAAGAMAGTDVAVHIVDGVTAPGTMEIRGTAVGSSTLITPETNPALNAWILAFAPNAKLMYRSKPTVSLAALPSAVLIGSDQAVMRFTVSADTAGDVSLAQLAARIVASKGVSLPSGGANYVLRRTGGDYLAATVTAPADVHDGTWKIALAAEETIPAGTSKSYDLVMGTTGTGLALGDSVSAKLLGDTAAAGVGMNVAALAGDSFVWSDQSRPSHSLATADWANGYMVKTLPTDTQVMSK